MLALDKHTLRQLCSLVLLAAGCGDAGPAKQADPHTGESGDSVWTCLQEGPPRACSELVATTATREQIEALRDVNGAGCRRTGSCPRNDGFFGTCLGAEAWGYRSREYLYMQSTSKLSETGQRYEREFECMQGNLDGPGEFTPADTFEAAPRDVALSGAVSLALGDESSCALLDDGTVWCWGTAWAGALADGTSELRPQWWATKVPGLADVKALAKADDDASCAVVSEGRVYCWGGRRSKVPTDQKVPTPVTSPVEIAGVSDVAQIVMSNEDVRVLTSSGRVLTWGFNKRSVTEVKDPPKVTRLENYRFAIVEGGGVFDFTSGKPYPELSAVTALQQDSGLQGGLCVLVDGRVRCTRQSAPRPDEVPVFSDVALPEAATALARGQSFAVCALLENHEAWCFTPGNLASSAISLYPKPKMVVQHAAFAAFAGNHGCAILMDKTVSCWGLNKAGERGAARPDDPPNAIMRASE